MSVARRVVTPDVALSGFTLGVDLNLGPEPEGPETSSLRDLLTSHINMLLGTLYENNSIT